MKGNNGEELEREVWANSANYTSIFNLLTGIPFGIPVASSALFCIGHANPIGLFCPPGLKHGREIRRLKML